VLEGLLSVVWSSGLWVGLVCGSKVCTFQWVWVALGQPFSGLGCAEETGPTDNSGLSVYVCLCIIVSYELVELHELYNWGKFQNFMA